ncbi:MAG TPA: hypothetical protein VFI29_00845 [Hanamia sp.]|nr:hypothetical protein [Hanamia sp.]
MKSNFRCQFWQHENHAILLNTKEMYIQRLVYFYENPNPERTGFVRYPIDCKYIGQLIIILKMREVY